MFKLCFLIASLAVLAGCQSTASQRSASDTVTDSQTNEAASVASDKNETLYCRNVRDTNSRMLRRECRTRGQVESARAEAEREATSRTQELNE